MPKTWFLPHDLQSRHIQAQVGIALGISHSTLQSVRSHSLPIKQNLLKHIINSQREFLDNISYFSLHRTSPASHQIQNRGALQLRSGHNGEQIAPSSLKRSLT